LKKKEKGVRFVEGRRVITHHPLVKNYSKGKDDKPGGKEFPRVLHEELPATNEHQKKASALKGKSEVQSSFLRSSRKTEILST